MIDVASIVIAVISTVGTLLLGIAGFLYTRSSDENKARSAAEKLVAKYRDPLLLASHDLQSRLYSIVDLSVASWLRSESPEERESLRLYTAFLVGQYLSWTYILRRQAQFLRFSTDKGEKNKELSRLLAKISNTFSTDDPKKGLSKAAFKLWRNQQSAIGELMTVSEGPELYCMGNAAFSHKFKDNISDEELQKELECHSFLSPAPSRKEEPKRSTHKEVTGNVPFLAQPPHGKDEVLHSDHKQSPRDISSQEFRHWFRPLIIGTNKIAWAKLTRNDSALDQRMRQLQHLLLDLMEVLDLKQSGIPSEYTGRCHRAFQCNCGLCKGTKACPCSPRRKDKCPFAGEKPRAEPQRSWFPSMLGVRYQKSLLRESPA